MDKSNHKKKHQLTKLSYPVADSGTYRFQLVNIVSKEYPGYGGGAIEPKLVWEFDSTEPIARVLTSDGEVIGDLQYLRLNVITGYGISPKSNLIKVVKGFGISSLDEDFDISIFEGQVTDITLECYQDKEGVYRNRALVFTNIKNKVK